MLALFSGIQDIAFIILTLIAEVVLVIAGFLVITYIKKGLTYLKVKTNGVVYTEIEKVVLNIVSWFNQKLVDEWKKNAVDGKLTPEQQSEVFNSAKSKIVEVLTSEQLTYLAQQYGDVELGIEYIIEKCVRTCDDSSSAILAEAILGGTQFEEMFGDITSPNAEPEEKTE